MEPKWSPILVWSDGQITEVKQSKTKNNTKMGDKLGSIHFFSLAMIGKISKFGCSVGILEKLNCVQKWIEKFLLKSSAKSMSVLNKNGVNFWANLNESYYIPCHFLHLMLFISSFWKVLPDRQYSNIFRQLFVCKTTFAIWKSTHNNILDNVKTLGYWSFS